MTEHEPEVGRAFVTALTGRDFASLRALMSEDVSFRMLLPSGNPSEAGPDAVIGRFVRWFGHAEPFELVASSVADVGGRTAVTYRLSLDRGEGPQIIEQHLMLGIDSDGRAHLIDLLCSGFRPNLVPEPAGRTHHFDAGDLSCADGLASEFRRQITQIPVGDVLVITASDPAAKEDLPPLARLMGHAVRSVEAPGDGRLLVTVERER
jgi:TusA-related sulfurtransferase